MFNNVILFAVQVFVWNIKERYTQFVKSVVCKNICGSCKRV